MVGGSMEARLQASEVEELLSERLPSVDQHHESVELVAASTVHLRLPFQREYLGGDRWGDSDSRVLSGPLMMTLADTSMYACVHAAFGREVTAVITNLSINFLRPAKDKDLLAQARVIRSGKRLVYLESYLYSDGMVEPIAHATASYSVRISSDHARMET